MTDGQENKFRMYQAVQKVCEDHNGVWSGMPAFVTAFNLFTANNDKVEDLRGKQEQDTTGYTIERDKVKLEMALTALEIAGSISAFASVSNDDILGKKVDFSFSELFYVRDTVAKNRASLIHATAVSIAADLVDYGTDTALIAKLNTLMNDFDDIVGGKLHAKEDTQTSTALLIDAFSENDELLTDRLDKLIRKWRTSDKHFFITYTGGREIIDSRGGGPRSDDVPEVLE